MKITIEGLNYILNTGEATRLGVLVKQTYPLEVGDVYIHPENKYNPFLLVQVGYKPEKYQLLGLKGGLAPNSGEFHSSIRSLDEIEKYLRDRNMVYKKNIQPQIGEVFRACVNS